MKATIAILIALPLALAAGCGDDSEPDSETGEAYAEDLALIVETEVDTATTKATDALINVLQGGSVAEAQDEVDAAARRIGDAETRIGDLDAPGAAEAVQEHLLIQLADYVEYLDRTPVLKQTASGKVAGIQAYRDGIDALAYAASDVATYDEP